MLTRTGLISPWSHSSLAPEDRDTRPGCGDSRRVSSEGAFELWGKSQWAVFTDPKDWPDPLWAGPGTGPVLEVLSACDQASKYLPLAATSQNDYWLDTIAVVLDGTVIAAPETEGAIPGGHAQVTGNFTRAQAEELAADLQSGALPVGFRVSAISTVTPSASSQAAAG
jgi:hypothetical protein